MFNSFFHSKYFNKFLRNTQTKARTIGKIAEVLVSKARAIATVRLKDLSRIESGQLEAIKSRSKAKSIVAIAKPKTIISKIKIAVCTTRIRMIMSDFITGSTVTIFIQFFDYFGKVVFPQTVNIEIYNATTTQSGTMVRNSLDQNLFSYEFDSTNKVGKYCYYIKSVSPQGVAQGEFNITPKKLP